MGASGRHCGIARTGGWTSFGQAKAEICEKHGEMKWSTRKVKVLAWGACTIHIRQWGRGLNELSHPEGFVDTDKLF